MPLNPLLTKIVWLVAILFSFAYFAQRWRLRRSMRKHKRHFGFYPNAVSLGNALQTLQILVQPDLEHVLEKKLDEHADEDDSGDDEDPLAHLHRQAARIRRGLPPDRLTARLPTRK